MRLWAPVLALVVLLSGCRTGGESSGPAIEQHHENGAAAISLQVDRDEITVADSLLVTLEATVPEGETLKFPEPGEKLGEFTLVGTTESEPRLGEDSRITLTRVYELEPFLPGDYEIPSLEISFGDGQSIATEPVSIAVVSVLPEGTEDPEIEEIAPPVGLPGFSWWVYALAALGLAAVTFLFWWRFVRKKPMEVEPAPAPHEVALRAMRELMAEDLIERGQAKLFYLRLSAILRHYIEDRFGLHAPESTTEEFLRDLRGAAHFNDRQKSLLQEFLVHCDMVKFAEYAPSREEIEGAINACGQFIAETKQTDTPVVTPQPAGSGR